MKSVPITVWAAVLLLCLACTQILAAATPDTGTAAPVGSILVNTVNDTMGTDGNCSLREAISAANLDAQVDTCPAGVGDDTIILPEGRFVLQLAGTGEDENATGDLDLRSDMTIIGASSGLTIIEGGGIDRVLDVHVGARLVMSGVTITNGATPDGETKFDDDGGDAEPGGGIRSAGDLWLQSCDVSGNRAGAGGVGHLQGGSGGDGGGIYNRGNLTLQLSKVAQNAAGDGTSGSIGPCPSYGRGGDGGGIWNDGMLVIIDSIITANQAGHGYRNGTGGGVWNSATLTITHSTISANMAGDAWVGGIGGSGGGIFNTGHLSLSHSTLSSNHAGAGSDWSRCSTLGPGGDGGAIFNSGWLFVSNCTLSGNRAGDGGGAISASGPGGNGGGVLNTGTAQLEYCTVSTNASGRLGSGYFGDDPGGDGGGIVIRGSGQITIRGTLLAENSAARNGPDCLGAITSQGYNLVQDMGSCTLVGDLTGNVIGLAARLAPLTDNGGLTWTHALRRDSPAIDRGDCLGLGGTLLTTDQRGKPRPLGGLCDVGAVEEWVLLRFPFIAK